VLELDVGLERITEAGGEYVHLVLLTESRRDKNLRRYSATVPVHCNWMSSPNALPRSGGLKH
jgi:hypothetical protein